jgi:hypothetical protein
MNGMSKSRLIGEVNLLWAEGKALEAGHNVGVFFGESLLLGVGNYDAIEIPVLELLE